MALLVQIFQNSSVLVWKSCVSTIYSFWFKEYTAKERGQGCMKLSSSKVSVNVGR